MKLPNKQEPAGYWVVPPLDLVPGTLLVAVGPGASGKSTYAATAAVDGVVYLDSLRREIGGDFPVKFCVLIRSCRLPGLR
ncbi:hypothetical protein ACIGDI_39995 [Streptomyces sp. NPDC085900]|uniref:hypothetical protein n=1 Tax=Streptomyces sp. NPDC085900 TaxID=3365737 RepID=UPI0037D6FE40